MLIFVPSCSVHLGHIYIYVYIYIYMYIHIYVSISIYIYTYINTHTLSYDYRCGTVTCSILLKFQKSALVLALFFKICCTFGAL